MKPHYSNTNNPIDFPKSKNKMNERILQLAEQARIKDHWSIDEGRYLTNYLDEQKFAELIVKECAKVAERADHSETEIRCMYEVVTEHFGVEK